MPGSAESEWLTRKSRIDPRLEAAGWAITSCGQEIDLNLMERKALEEFPTENGPADYALCLGGEVVAVVEAKKLTVGPQGVLTQAERYSRGCSVNPLKFRDFRVPFLYSTNGEVTWFCDIRHPLYRSREVSGFHSPNAVREMLARDAAVVAQWFKDNGNVHERLRPYQLEANAAVERAIVAGRRRMLLAMATGTGKTFTMVNQCHRLLKAGAARRILFLVDRRALAAQAVRAFASFGVTGGLKFNQEYEVYSQRFRVEDVEGEPFDPKVLPKEYLTDPKPAHTFVYVCTIQRMARYVLGKEASFGSWELETDDDDEDKLPIPIHAFDAIIADECHRGYSAADFSVWRKTLDHFDGIKIGLTATPAAHTKAYFDEIVYRYEYERAVREGHLVDYDAVSIRSNVRMNGVFLRSGESVEFVNAGTGQTQLDLLEDERQFDISEIEDKVTAPDSNKKILEEVAKYALQHEEDYGRFPKTLIFADNDLPHTSHCDQLVKQARDIFGRGDAFVQKITGRVDRPLQRIREFRNRPNPGIVVTVDLLTTGVDIPDLEFIVFLRPVKSRILFEQMIGRGTRKGEKYPNKSHFTVFDCFDGTLLAYFKQATGITADEPDRPTRTIVQIIREIADKRDYEYNVRCLVKRLQRIDKEAGIEAREQFAAFIPDGDIGGYARRLPDALLRDFKGAMELLLNPQFQDVLVNYKRPERTFVRAIETEDTVDSELLIRGGRGQEFKPQDYLKEFEEFVRRNEDKLDAIQILVNRPKDWSTQALVELRKALKEDSYIGFDESRLQEAHRITYRVALADIISMVKRAVRSGEPLMTAEERVRRAIENMLAGRRYSAAQEAWLNRIRNHLVANLTVDSDDFDVAPVLSRAGGWRKADRDFGGRLADLLAEINERVAA